ncbi:MAG: hypothetical protein AAF050_07125 [Cyanobacteria bacterium J06649_5]
MAAHLSQAVSIQSVSQSVSSDQNSGTLIVVSLLTRVNAVTCWSWFARNSTFNRDCHLMPSIEERVDKIFATRQITRTDQTFLMSVFASGKISSADEALINKIYEALSAGRLKVVE